MRGLILASASKARQDMLGHAGYQFEVCPADLDENALIENNQNEGAALLLAREKAKTISEKHQDSYIIGSDQILLFDGRLFSKSKSKEDAIKKLQALQGKTHHLVSAVSVYKNGEELFFYEDKASLSMRKLSNESIENYADHAGDILTQCVGCYALEGIGLRLFNEIHGNFFTILGMPLLPLSNFLDSEGFEL